MTSRCKICEGEFYTDSLQDGKCSICRKFYPGANNLVEAKEQFSTMFDLVLPLVEKKIDRLIEDKIVSCIEKKDIPAISEYIRNKITEELVEKRLVGILKRHLNFEEDD